MDEPKAITYKEVEKAGGNTDTWHKIGDITGAGHIPINADGDASIDLTGIAEGKQGQIDRLLGKAEEAKDEAAEADTKSKRGNK